MSEPSNILSHNGTSHLPCGPSLDEIQECYRPLAQTHFKIQAVGARSVQVAHYIDARAAARVLDLVFAGDWSARVAAIEPDGREVTARLGLTVRGASREGVGGGHDPKAAVSDALKRAAVLFGIGAYLYAIPRTYLPKDSPLVRLVSRNGRERAYISDDGERSLRAQFTEWLAGPGKAFGEVRDLGDAPDAIGDQLDAPEDGEGDDRDTARSGRASTNGGVGGPLRAIPGDGQGPVADLESRCELLELAERCGYSPQTLDGLVGLLGHHTLDRLPAEELPRVRSLLAAATAGGVRDERLAMAIARAREYSDGSEKLAGFLTDRQRAGGGAELPPAA